MARNREPNKPIGTAPCPFRNCQEVGKVYRFRAQSDDPGRQRRAGRLYMRCDVHGMTQDQDWILERGSIEGAPQPDKVSADRPGEPAPEPESKPAKAPASDTPAQKPAPATTGDDAPGWGFF